MPRQLQLRTIDILFNLQPQKIIGGVLTNQDTIAPGAAVTAYCYAFTAGQVTGSEFGSFANVFDEYRIFGIKFEFIPNNLVVGTATSVGSVGGYDNSLYAIADFNSSVVFSNKTQIWDYPSIKRMSAVNDKTGVIQIRPGCLTTAFDTGGTAQTGNMVRTPWLNTSTSTYYHYGVKTYMDAVPATTTLPYGYWTVKVTGHFQFRKQY